MRPKGDHAWIEVTGVKKTPKGRPYLVGTYDGKNYRRRCTKGEADAIVAMRRTFDEGPVAVPFTAHWSVMA